MSLDSIAALLTRKTGLDPATLGPDALGRAVRHCMAGCNLSDCDQYEALLADSDEQWQLLLDELVVRETWFFRDWMPFVFLQRHVVRQWLPAHPGRVLSVFSVPCATGEEPYSIAMALLDAGMSRQSFRIDAVDVSRTAIARSREAVYGAASFRGENLEFRQRYFTAVGAGFRPLPEVTASVTFRQGNLLDEQFLAAGGPYDAVFCRNLLIYFDLAARKRASENLYRLLADDGLLFAGHTESTYTFGPRFAPLDEPRAFAYRKAPAVAAPEPRQAAPVPSVRRADFRLDNPARPPLACVAASPAKPAPVEDSKAILQRAGRLADEGSLDDAALLCRQLVAGPMPCVEAYCLLGLIEEARGNKPQAEDCYNRALYLNPEHYESLIHLLLLVESRGDHARADTLRARAGRIRDKESTHAG